MITQLTGNGRLLLTVNEDGEWNDLFFPYPGEFQHLREARLGVYDVAERSFSWLRRPGSFRVEQSFPGAANPVETVWQNGGLRVDARDHVHPNHDLVIRLLRVHSDRPRRLRLFSYQSLQIGASLYQETAYVDAEARALMHYKHGYYFEFFSEPDFSQAVCGEHTLKGLQGTYVDAEDGRLDGRLISHGAADSVIQWDLAVTPERDARVRLFLAAGQSLDAAHRVRDYVRSGDSTRFERESHSFWRTWVARHPPQVASRLSERAREVYQTSVVVLRNAASSVTGAIVASPDTRSLVVGGDSYNYCWWRDGSYIAKAMDEARLYDHAHRFLRFALQCQSPDGSFLHRHFPDGHFGSTWHPPPFLQVDQTGSVISAVWHHFKRRVDLDVLLDLWPMVKSAANFLLGFRDPETGLPAASFDLWEERNAIHTYSTAAVVHGLERAARIASELGKDPSRWRVASQEIRAAALRHLWDDASGRLLRGINPRDEKLDASLLLALKLGLLEWRDPRARAVVDAVERRLWVPRIGGLARYEGDAYYGSENPWIVCTLWLAEARLNLGDQDRCGELLEWVAQRSTPTRLLPEQLDPATGDPRSATPLTWSHSTYVDVVHKFRRTLSGSDDSDD